MVDHSTAMKIRANRATLGELPPPGVRWEWCDVVDKQHTGEGVKPKHAHAVVGMLDRHEDGRYETTRELQAYLRGKYSIECTGTVHSVQQATLPEVSDDRDFHGDSRVVEAAVEDRSPTSPGRVVQLTLGGEDASGDVDRLQARERIEARGRMRASAAKHEVAERDARQARLQAFDERRRVTVGRLSKRAGGVYGGGRRVTVDA